MKIFFLMLFFSIQVSAQGWLPSGGKSMSMSNASVSVFDEWAHFNNPGAVGASDQVMVGISYENRFLLKELQGQSVVAVIPMKLGAISVGGHMYGYRLYRSFKGGVGYSLPLAENFYAGVQLNFQGIQLSENYGSKNTMTAEAGLYYKIKDNWNVGISVFNLGRAKLAEFNDDRFSTVMRFGTSYLFSDKFLVSAEVDKDLEFKPRFRVGLEYQIVENFFTRAGVATNRTEMSFGFGYRMKTIEFSIGSAYDQLLGWSPHFSISYKGKKE